MQKKSMQSLASITASVSPEEIEAAKSPKGAWTAKTLRKWGVHWPPPKGWRAKLVKNWEKNPSSQRQEPLGKLYEEAYKSGQSTMQSKIASSVFNYLSGKDPELASELAVFIRSVDHVALWGETS
jgi:hypothetical protein